MRKLLSLAMLLMAFPLVHAANEYDNPDTLFVAADGSAEFRSVNEALEVCRAFMDYHKVIFVKKGVYKENCLLYTSPSPRD